MLGVKMWLRGLVRSKSCVSGSWVDLSFSRGVDKSVKENKWEGIRAGTEKASCSWLRSLIGLWLTTFLCGPLSDCPRSFYFNHILFVFLSSEFFPPSSPLLLPGLSRLSLCRPCLLLSNLICFHTWSVYTYSCCRQTSPHCRILFPKSHFPATFSPFLCWLLNTDPPLFTCDGSLFPLICPCFIISFL